MLAFERFATKIDIVSCGCIPSPFRIMITYRVESPVARRISARGYFVISRRCEPLTVLIHSRTGRLAQYISSCVQRMVPWRRRAHHSKHAGGRGAGSSCRRHRDPVLPFSDPALAAPAGSVGISAAVVVATWRAAMLDDPRIDQLAPDRFRRRKRAFYVCAHQPANSRRHQRPGAPSAAARPALRSMFPPTPAHPR